MLVAHPGHHSDHYTQFKSLLAKSLAHIQQDALVRPDYYVNRNPFDFEEDVRSSMEKNLGELPFKIELVSGAKFPDIVAHVNETNAFGVEVKTTRKNNWHAIGGSIMESTRVPNVERIHVFFGKLCNPLGFVTRPYEDCIDDVRITHSPRYHLNLKQADGKSFFKELGISYDDLRKNPQPFDPIREYFRKHRTKEGEDVWWLEPSSPNLVVQHWSNLPSKRQKELVGLGFAICPEIFGANPAKYKIISVMLAATQGVVNHHLRDQYSASGTVDFQGTPIPRIFQNYLDHKEEIRRSISTISESDISHYWNKRNVGDREATWKSLALKHATDNQKNSSILSAMHAILGK